jgi:peptidoglycan/LPS O-acetylase OafA/YrhL
MEACRTDYRKSAWIAATKSGRFFAIPSGFTGRLRFATHESRPTHGSCRGALRQVGPACSTNHGTLKGSVFRRNRKSACHPEERSARGPQLMSHHRPDIDGLRAIAVLAVLLYHAGFGLPGGFVGVDVFFVISGFLIVGLIDRDVAAGTFSLGGFILRRARRLVPAMTAMLIATTVAAAWILLPHDLREFGQSLVAQGVGLANFYFWRESGYFAGQSEIKPLLHMWSLAVEEQFYVLMPLFFLAAARLQPRIRLAALLALAAVSFGFSVALSRPYPDSSFYLLHTRAWELLVGGIASQLVRRMKLGRWFSEVVSAAGLVVILASTLVISIQDFPGWRAAIPCMGTVAVLVANTECSTLVSRVLSLRPLVFVGLISCSLYLWHWPPFAFANYLKVEPLSVVTRATLLILSFSLAVASWRFIETPFRSGRFWHTSKATAVGFATCASMVLAIGLGIHIAKGFPARFPDESLAFAEGRKDRNPHRAKFCDQSVARLENSGLPRLDKGSAATAPVLLIVGDSHCDAMMPAFRQLADEYGIPTVAVASSATPPLLYSDLPDERGRFLRFVGEYLNATSSIKDVILVARWGHYPDSLSAAAWRNALDRILGKDRRAWIVLPLPENTFDVPRALALAAAGTGTDRLPRISRATFASQRDQATEIFGASSSPRVCYVDCSRPFFDVDGRAILSCGNRALYIDSHHISTHAAMMLVPELRPVFRAIAGEASPLSQSSSDE